MIPMRRRGISWKNMEELKKHELFEIEVLEKLKNAKFLLPLVFTGGTMLRLCHDMRRYSSDLDFWFIKKVNFNSYYKKLKDFLEKNYTLTDSQNKYFTLLFEFGSPEYPKKLKIEIRKRVEKVNFQEKIAYSPYTNKQVILRCLSLEEMLKNKIDAFLDRKEIRDCFDIEFLLRQGIKINEKKEKLVKILKAIKKFKKNDYAVKLGSTLEPEMRKYYLKNKFSYLTQQINTILSFQYGE